MNFTISLLIFKLLTTTNLDDSYAQKSFEAKKRIFYLSEAGFPEITGYHKLTQTLIFPAIKSATHKIEGSIKNITPIIQAKAYAAFLETFNITNTNLVVLFAHSP